MLHFADALHGNPSPVSPAGIMQQSHSPLLPWQKHNRVAQCLFICFIQNKHFLCVLFKDQQKVVCHLMLLSLMCAHMTCSVSFRQQSVMATKHIRFIYSGVISVIYFLTASLFISLIHTMIVFLGKLWTVHLFLSISHCQCPGPLSLFVVF